MSCSYPDKNQQMKKMQRLTTDPDDSLLEKESFNYSDNIKIHQLGSMYNNVVNKNISRDVEGMRTSINP